MKALGVSFAFAATAGWSEPVTCTHFKQRVINQVSVKLAVQFVVNLSQCAQAVILYGLIPFSSTTFSSSIAQ